MPMASRKPATKRAPTQQATRPMRATQRVQRAVRRDHMPAGEKGLEDVIADRGFSAQPGDIRAEEIEIDPQLDDSDPAEP